MKTRILSLILLNLLLTACGVNAPPPQPELPPTRATEAEAQAETQVEAPLPTLPQPVQSEVSSEPAAEIEPIDQVDTTANESVISAPALDQNSQNSCDTSAFIDVQPDAANSQYATPELNVYCQGDSMIIESTGIPNFEFVQISPGGLSAQNHQWEIPLNPQIAAAPTDIPILGTVAFAVNGLPIYGPNEAANLGWGDPILDEVLDFCNGHTGGQGDYHYHGRPDCLFANWEGSTSLIMGYSLDGFPILSPYICEDAACSSVKKVESSWQRTQDVTAAWDAHEYIAGSGDLDQCNGLVLPDGSYAYFATDTFPYIQACYTGTPSASAGGNAPGGGQGGQEGQQGQQGQPPQGDGGQQGGQQGQQGQPPQGGEQNSRGPDFAAAAAQLGVSEQALRDALGDPPPDFSAAAAALGVSEEALRDALGPPPGQ